MFYHPGLNPFSTQSFYTGTQPAGTQPVVYYVLPQPLLPVFHLHPAHQPDDVNPSAAPVQILPSLNEDIFISSQTQHNHNQQAEQSLLANNPPASLVTEPLNRHIGSSTASAGATLNSAAAFDEVRNDNQSSNTTDLNRYLDVIFCKPIPPEEALGYLKLRETQPGINPYEARELMTGTNRSSHSASFANSQTTSSSASLFTESSNPTRHSKRKRTQTDSNRSSSSDAAAAAATHSSSSLAATEAKDSKRKKPGPKKGFKHTDTQPIKEAVLQEYKDFIKNSPSTRSLAFPITETAKRHKVSTRAIATWLDAAYPNRVGTRQDPQHPNRKPFIRDYIHGKLEHMSPQDLATEYDVSVPTISRWKGQAETLKKQRMASTDVINPFQLDNDSDHHPDND